MKANATIRFSLTHRSDINAGPDACGCSADARHRRAHSNRTPSPTWLLRAGWWRGLPPATAGGEHLTWCRLHPWPALWWRLEWPPAFVGWGPRPDFGADQNRMQRDRRLLRLCTARARPSPPPPTAALAERYVEYVYARFAARVCGYSPGCWLWGAPL